MSSLTLKHVNKTYPNGFVAVKDLSLHIEDGEFVTFFGPSGSGKSAVLRMIGGLEDITLGEIYLGDTLLNEVLPRDRQLAMAFQNYALYKHINVYDNIALGLMLRDMPRSVIDARVKAAGDFFGISAILDKKIRSVSEADKQRVALSRAIVCRPKILLVDREFARGNESRLHELLFDIKRINKELEITVLYATNDYKEALMLDQKIVSMKEGQAVEIIKLPS